MNYRFGDVSDPSSRAGKIRALFRPGTTIAQHSEYCLRKGVLTESEILGMASSAFRAEVRDALGQIMDGGMPFAGPTRTRKDNRPAWRQTEFWSKRDFDYNYSEYKRREQANGRVAAAIARECRSRFGADPVYVEIVEDDPAEA